MNTFENSSDKNGTSISNGNTSSTIVTLGNTSYKIVIDDHNEDYITFNSNNHVTYTSHSSLDNDFSVSSKHIKELEDKIEILEKKLKLIERVMPWLLDMEKSESTQETP